MPKACIILFFLLLGGDCAVGSVQNQRVGKADAPSWLDATAPMDLDVEMLATPQARGGSKFKKQDKKQPDTDAPQLEPGVGARRTAVSGTLACKRSFLPVPGYYRHLHRQALF